MSIRSAALSVMLLAAAVSGAFAEDKQATAAGEPQWAEFQSAERGFAVSFPGTPKTTSAPVEGQNPLLQYDFQVSVSGDTVYSVIVFEYPAGKGPSPDNDTYLKLVNAYAKGSESRLRKRGAATIAGRPGFEAIADDGNSKLSHLIDVIPAGDRIYMLVTAGPRGHATSKDAVRFRDSFRALESDAASPGLSASNPGGQ
ncbi:MAG TPA: hypothetical protein VEW64_10205 [Methyloceanibacter sp.]|jgi:hypothetical protein|nr:hypothetical protein [Methyloceanibacter sp.]